MDLRQDFKRFMRGVLKLKLMHPGPRINKISGIVGDPPVVSPNRLNVNMHIDIEVDKYRVYAHMLAFRHWDEDIRNSFASGKQGKVNIYSLINIFIYAVRETGLAYKSSTLAKLTDDWVNSRKCFII